MYRVMIVDDEPFILDGLCDSVDWSSIGLELSGRAENGRQALDKLREIDADLLITDITMPIMDGLELIEQAREIYPDLLVIILSGYNEFDYLKKGMQLGIENYLLKPVNFTELYSTLESVVQKLNDSSSRIYIQDDVMDMIRDSLLYRKMTGQIMSDVFNERAAMLGLKMEGEYVTTIIIRCQSELDELMFRQIHDWMQAQFPSCVCFRNMERNIVIVWMMNNRDECRRAATACASDLRMNKWLQQYRISIGSTEQSGNEKLSYESALRAQQYYMLLTPSEIADYDQFHPLHDNKLIVGETDWDALARCLMAKDSLGLIDRIRGEFNRLRDQEGTRPDQLRSLAMEMMVRLKMELDGINRSGMWTEEPFQFNFERVIQADDLEQLIGIVIDTALIAVNELEREDKSPIIRQVLLHIEEHYEDDLTLKSLAKQYNIHAVYLGKLFHQQTGDTFTDYFNRFRIGQAKTLLRETPLKVHEIANKVGYWDTGYFYKQFKRYVGISPTEFKSI